MRPELDEGRTHSRDGGRTWTNSTPLTPGILRSDPVLRFDKNGRLYYLSLTNTGPNGFSCQLFTSLDGGAHPRQQRTAGAEQLELVRRDVGRSHGRLDAVWNDTRESLNATLSRTYYAFSNHGGTTWQGHTPITPQWNSVVGWPNQNKIGDYYDMWSDRVGAFLAMSMTPAGEQDVFCLRIGGYDCNSNGIDDAADIAAGTPDCNGNGIPDSCEIAAGVSVNCASCYANCDGSTATPRLTANDFQCFVNAYAAGQAYANCDGSTGNPLLTANDFQCFVNAYAAGCS